MYRYISPEQMFLDGFKLQFNGKLRADNRWVTLSKQMPWDRIDEIYRQNFSLEYGAGAISSRIAFGAIYAKEHEEWTDRETVQNIMENPYVQYLLIFLAKAREMVEKDPPKPPNGDGFPPDDNAKNLDESAKNKGKLLLDATVAPADIRYPTDQIRKDQIGNTQSVAISSDKH